MISVEAFNYQYALSSLYFPRHNDKRSRDKYRDEVLTHHMENSCPGVTQIYSRFYIRINKQISLNYKPLFEDWLLLLHKQLTLTTMVIYMMRLEQALKAQISLKNKWFRHPSHVCLLSTLH